MVELNRELAVTTSTVYGTIGEVNLITLLLETYIAILYSVFE